ncbi:outer membrane beta-barrel protein [Massilia sp. CCM 8694]|uniref:Outer membrane beta-barrel protein n=1 Tax=Massilia genomosp. 1 TaxID=2609280 RepID=A0ABX0MQ22_9BURK|nr:outer membrane beta-barrel protein [Massilia genomosp. 1]
MRQKRTILPALCYMDTKITTFIILPAIISRSNSPITRQAIAPTYSGYFMRMILSSALVALAAGVSMPASAVENGPGVYAGVQLGQASSSNDRIERDDLSIGLRTGYQINKHIGVELFRNSLSFIEIGYGFNRNEPAHPEEHYGIAVTGAFPLSERFDLTGRAGIGRTRMHAVVVGKDDYNETDPSIGGGVRFNFNPHWSMNAEAMRLTKTKVTVISTGFRYQF